MRRWGLLAGLLGLAVWVLPAHAADDLAEMNAVSRTWDRYAELSGQDKPESADLLAASSLVHFGFLRDAALYASTDQLRRIPLSDRLLVYLLRAAQPAQQLQGMDDHTVAALCLRQGWAGVNADDEGRPAVSIVHVTLLGERAVGETGSPSETQYQFGPDFVREDGAWKYRYESMVPDTSAYLERSFRESGASDTSLMENVLASLLRQDEPPRLAVLDRPPLDDAARRQRLNESWPDYKSGYRYRFDAIRRKADDGDAFAQLTMGTLKLLGNLPEYVARDEEDGLRLLESASDNGNARAGLIVSSYLLSDPAKVDEARVARALPHLQRAAAAGIPEAMSPMGRFYMEGLGGLPRDCRRAADWQARAEEAGIAQARNEQVWTWATCPVPAQRDPARALALAQYMIENRDGLSYGELDTVAAAYAANGDFADAVAYQTSALGKLDAGGAAGPPPDYVQRRMRARLDGYRRGKDYVLDYTLLDEAKAAKR